MPEGDQPEPEGPPSISFEGPVQKLAHADVNPNLTYYRRWKSSEQPLYHRRYCTLTGMELTYWHIIASNTINNSGKKKRMSSKMSHKKASTLHLKRDHVFDTTGTVGEFTIMRENDPTVRLRVVGEKRAEKAEEWVKALRRACGKTEDAAALIVGHDSSAEEDSSDDDEVGKKLAEEANMADGEWTRGETSISATVVEVAADPAAATGGRKSKRPSLLSNFKSDFEEEGDEDAGEIDLDAIGESEEFNAFEEHKEEQDAADAEDAAHEKLLPMVAKETNGDPEKAEEKMAMYLDLHGSYVNAFDNLSVEAGEAGAEEAAPAAAAPVVEAPKEEKPKGKLKMGGLLMKAHKSGNLEGAVDDMEAALGDGGGTIIIAGTAVETPFGEGVVSTAASTTVGGAVEVRLDGLGADAYLQQDAVTPKQAEPLGAPPAAAAADGPADGTNSVVDGVLAEKKARSSQTARNPHRLSERR
jgi:hypothetical protein